METIKYTESFLKLVSTLSVLTKRDKDGNSPIKFVKDLEGVHIKIRNSSETVMILVDASSDEFDFPGDELCFYDYRDFYNYVTSFNKPELSIGTINPQTPKETEAIVISENKRKLNYPTTDSEVIGRENFKGLPNIESQTTFNFSSENYQSLKKILSLFKDDKTELKFDFNGNKVLLSLSSKLNSNSYEEEFELSEKVPEEFSIIISQEVFKYLVNTNYIVEVNNDLGILTFKFETGSIRVAILTNPEEKDD